MNTSYRGLLEATIGSEPPTRLNVDELMAASRRRLHRRRLVIASGAIAITAVSLLTAALATGFGTPLPDPATVTTATGVATARPEPTLKGATPTEDPRTAQIRLAGAMRLAVSSAVPSAKVGGEFTVRHGATVARLLADGNWYAPSYYFEGQQTLEAAGVHGVITISVSRLLESDACIFAVQQGPIYATCQQSVGPQGELVVVEHLADTDNAGTLRRTIVRVDRPDGSAIWVISSNNVDLAPAPSLTGGPPPLTVAQLTAIALDPRLTLYPA